MAGTTTVRRGLIGFVLCMVMLPVFCATTSAGEYYYYHVWMSDTDNPAYPKPGALTNTLWESFSYWPNWQDCTPTLQTDPTTDEVLSELGHYRDLVDDGDFFLFYYTGHSQMIEVEYYGSEAQDLRLGISAGDSGAAITVDTLKRPEYFGGFSADSTVMIVLDTCYAGQALGEPYGFSALGGPVDALDNMAVLAASGADEEIGLYPQNYAMWPPGNWDYVSSYFTQGIIEGLAPTAAGSPVADLSSDGILSAEELFNYASWRIEDVGGSGGLFWHDVGEQELSLIGTTPTPEPGTLLLFLPGVGSLIAFLRRRRQN